MCGLVGAIGTFVQNDRDAIGDLLILDKYRGKDSTGVALIDRKDKTISIAKELGVPWHLFNSYDCFDDEGSIVGNYKAVIGHNRAATRGKVSVENAHPFLQGHITGAHNGTLKSGHKMEDFNKFDVDSEAIFYNIAKHGIKATMSNVEGAYALTFYNQLEDKMYFLRNFERPLHVVRRKDKDVIFWASEEWMLKLALGRNKIETDDNYISLLPDHLYSVDLSTEEVFRTKELKDEGRIEGYIPPPLPPSKKHSSGGGRAYQGWWEDNYEPPRNKGRNARVVREKVPVDLNKYIGKTVEFYFFKEGRTNGLKYLECLAQGEDQFEIRIFNTNKYEELKSLATTWTATVKKFASHTIGGVKHTYALVDYRSIKDNNDMFDKKTGQMTPLYGPSNVFANSATGKPDTVIFTHNDKTGKLEQMSSGGTTDTIPFKNGAVIPFIKPKANGMYKGYRGDEFTEEEYQQITAHGCCWCEQSVSPTDSIKWISHHEFLCSNCASNPDLSVFAGTVSSIGH